MELLVNDLSLHGQFQDLASFREAIERVMAMRQVAQRFGRALYCHRNMANAQVTATLSMPEAVRGFTLEQTRALLSWLHRFGPFWEEVRLHSPDHYLECNGDIVTDTAVGEAGYCCIHGVDRHLVSLIPSNWTFSPVRVTWVPDAAARQTVDVSNHFDVTELEAALEAAPLPIGSWGQLEETAIARCGHLTFSEHAFRPLKGYPFSGGAAQRILILLVTLNRFKSCFDEDGKRTPEGQRLYQDHFTGDKAWFSDSSDTEKREFSNDLAFPHPADANKTLFCPMHGKEKSHQLRIHFSSPINAAEPLYVVYIGQKITRR